MFTIGDFANLGRVSVRMLRHYDSIGALSPAAVDPVNGYRLYNADQLSRLNEARLRIIESEGTMSTKDVVLKPVGSIRVAEVAEKAATFQTVDISPVIQSMYPRLMQDLAVAGVNPTGYGIAYYEPVDSDDSVIIHAGIMVDAEPRPDRSFAVLDLRLRPGQCREPA